jgi:pimeloyl-ACP methyl ester carboxylesterase
MSADDKSKAVSIRVGGAHGLQLHALEWSRDGVPLVLLHGFSNEAHIWDDVAAAVAPYYRTVALDLRGHGDSDWDPERRYDYDSHVADLEAATAALGIERMVLVGHSFGGRVAMFFAGRHPERIAGLVIVDSGPEHDPRGALRIRLETESRGDGSFESRLDYRSLMERNYPAASPAIVDRLADHSLREREDGRFEPKLDPGFFRVDSNLSAAEQKRDGKATGDALWKALGRIAAPTLVIRGAASDVLSADVADRMMDVLPAGQLAVVGQASHSVMTDNPAGTLQAITAFALSDA